MHIFHAVRCGALAILLLWSAVATGQSDEAIDQLLGEGKFDEALVEVNAALTADADNVRLKLQKGFILIKLRKLEEAEAFYTGLIAEQPDNPEPMNNLGVIYQLGRQYQQAIDQLNATIEKFPEFGRAYENLGDTYIQMASDSYAAGQQRVDGDPMLISKSDLALRFYGLAHANRDAALERHNQQSGQQTAGSAVWDNADAGANDAANSEQAIAEFLRSWVVAWSGQNVDTYFDHYGPDFNPADGRTLSVWQDRKREIISAAEFINIRVDSIEVVDQSEQDVTLKFMQNYESNTYQSESEKTLGLREYPDGWKIISES